MSDEGLQRFFTERLRAQLDASSHTVAGYRDALRLLLRFAAKQFGRELSQLRLGDPDTGGASSMGVSFLSIWKLNEATARRHETM